jgi:hypothetical protein
MSDILCLHVSGESTCPTHFRMHCAAPYTALRAADRQQLCIRTPRARSVSKPQSTIRPERLAIV